MKIALIADVHANAPALQAVLADAEKQGAEAVWFLGDVLGYGPLPVSCINLLDRYEPPIWLMGNHDLAGVLIWRTGREEPDGIGRLVPTPAEEWRVILWHVEQLKVGLSPDRLQRLAAAPTWTEALPGIYAAHGAVRSSDPTDAKNVSNDGNSYIQPFSPALDETLENLEELAEKSGAVRPWLLVVAHTHRLSLCRVGWEKPRRPEWQEGPELPVNSEPVALETPADGLIVFCPGSAGYLRPSFGDPRVSYALLDPDNRQVWFRRVAYNRREAWAAMIQPPRPLQGAVAYWADLIQAADCEDETPKDETP